MKKFNLRMAVILKYSKGIKRYFLYTVLFSLVATALNSLTPQVIRLTVDNVIGGIEYELPEFISFIGDYLAGNALVNNLIIMAAAVIIISLLSGASTFISKASTAKSSETFIKRLHDALFYHTQKLPMSFHSKHQTGDIIQRCTSDTEVIRKFIASQLTEIFRTTFLIGISLYMMFSMNVRLSFISLAFIPVIVLYSGVFYTLISKSFRVADEAEGALSSVVQENLSGVRVVRAFGRQQFEIDKFDEKNISFSKFWIKLGSISGIYWSLGDLITGLQIMAIIVVGVIEAVDGNLTAGEYISFISYSQSLIWPVRGLGRILSEMSKAGVSFDRVDYILGADEEPHSEDDVKSLSNCDIEFDNVSFEYEEGIPILKNVSFKIKTGETFAILGSTGSGKSTIISLLGRFYDVKEGDGSIKIGGVDIRKIDLKTLRETVGIILQEPFLYSRTIEENIKSAQSSKSLAEVRSAAEIACVDDNITEFTDGYDTMVGEKGVTLSGGQKQRVSIARTLMSETPVLIFDDSLSAVDAQTDSKIRKALKERLKESTVIIVSHRITTLMQADKILVIDDGKVVESGSHEELLNQNGIYKEVYDVQMHREEI